MINRRLIYCSSVRPHPPQSLQFVRGSAESGGEYRVTYAVVQLINRRSQGMSGHQLGGLSTAQYQVPFDFCEVARARKS